MLEFVWQHPIGAAVVLLALLLLQRYLVRTRERVKIARLGARPPHVTTYLPLGIDVALKAIKHTRSGNDLGHWKHMFSHGRFSCHTVEVHAGRQRFIFTADPENIKAVLATQFNDYGKGKEFHDDWEPFLGDSIFGTDGELWHGSRQLIRPQFVKEKVRDLDIVENHVQSLLSHLDGSGRSVNISALFYRFTLDAATEYLLGRSCGSLDSPYTEFGEAFVRAQKVQDIRTRIGPLRFLINRVRFFKDIKIINAFIETFIEAALTIDPSQLEAVKNPSFLQCLALEGVKDRKVIRDQVVAVLLAGRDTTASTLSFLFLELSRNPSIFKKLRDEILRKVGKTERPTYEDLKAMPYLRSVTNEVLRLYPSVPFNIRTALRDTTLPTGGGPDGKDRIGVLEGTPVAYSTMYMQRRKDLYPTDAEFPPCDQFCPERWEMWQPKPWTYLPFNGGPRICVGQQFALTEIAYTVVRLLQRFDRIEGFTPLEGPQYRCEVVISPWNGVHVGFWEPEQKA